MSPISLVEADSGQVVAWINYEMLFPMIQKGQPALGGLRPSTFMTVHVTTGCDVCTCCM